MGYADPKFSRNQFFFVVGAFVLAIVLLIAVTCRGEAQTPQCTFTRGERDTVRTMRQPGRTLYIWAARDTVVATCRDRVDTMWLPRPDTTPGPAPTPPPDTTPAPPPPPSGGPFAPPDIHNVTFDQPGDNAKFVTSLGLPFPLGYAGAWHTLDLTGGRNGSKAMRIQLRAASGFEPVGISWAPRGRAFYRWYFRTQGTPGGNVKGVIVRQPNGPKVGDFYGGAPCWTFDTEGEAHCFNIGLSYTSQTAHCGPLANGQWHSIEIDYNRNAGANVELRIWCDGNAVVLPVGPAPSPFGGPYPAVQFVGGDRASNTPTTIRTARQGPSVFGELTFWETISQGVNGVVVWIDDIAVSSQRIGP